MIISYDNSAWLRKRSWHHRTTSESRCQPKPAQGRWNNPWAGAIETSASCILFSSCVTVPGRTSKTVAYFAFDSVGRASGWSVCLSVSLSGCPLLFSVWWGASTSHLHLQLIWNWQGFLFYFCRGASTLDPILSLIPLYLPVALRTLPTPLLVLCCDLWGC